MMIIFVTGRVGFSFCVEGPTITVSPLSWGEGNLEGFNQQEIQVGERSAPGLRFQCALMSC